MTIGVPPETLAKFGLPFTASYRLVVDALNRIYIAGLPRAPTYTVVTVPSAANAGAMIYVSDETGGAVLAFADGTNWRRVTDRSVVS
jgi:hypothetical protein